MPKRKLKEEKKSTKRTKKTKVQENTLIQSTLDGTSAKDTSEIEDINYEDFDKFIKELEYCYLYHKFVK